jgi:type IV secretory pathway VirB10-like protein
MQRGLRNAFHEVELNRGNTMTLTTLLSSAILFILAGAIVPAYAQEHGQEKQAEQKQPSKPAQHQQTAKPAQQAKHQQPAKPAKQAQQAHEQQHAKPAKPAQQAHQQQAKPAQQQQRASRGAQTAAGRGSIPEAKFRSNFGSSHTFHVSRSEFAHGSGRFQYGGYWFNVVDPWPVAWLYTDNVYVDYLNGGYFLCNPAHPGVFISINIG